jgi:hypothetical protein
VTDARVSREHVEVLHANTPDARISREHLEALQALIPDARVSREHVEVLGDPKPDERIHTLRPEALIEQTRPPIRVHAERYEVLYSPTLLSAPDLRAQALRFEALLDTTYAATWWDGSARQIAKLRGWWDGTTIRPLKTPRIYGFNPAALSGLAVWFDASQLAGATGSNVSPWPNLAAGGPAGTMVTNPGNDILPIVSTNTLNGKKLVRFYNNQARMRVTGTGVTLDWTLAYVARMVPAGINVGRIVNGIYAPNNILWGFWNGFQDVAYDQGFMTPNTQTSVTTNWKLYSADGAAGSPSTSRLLSNGVVLGSTTTSQGWGGTFAISGYDPSSTAETCDCEIAEVLLWNRKLPDVDRQAAEGYLREKWAIPTP